MSKVAVKHIVSTATDIDSCGIFQILGQVGSILASTLATWECR